MTKLIYRLFIFVLLFAPLAFGTVEQWSLVIVETLSLFALTFFFYRKAGNERSSVYEIPGIIPLCLLLAYLTLQLLPLPAGVVRLVSPEVFALLKTATWADGPVKWSSLSINPKATLTEFCRLAAYAAFYILTVQLLTQKDLLKKTVAVIAIFASLLSFFGILQHILSNNKIFWLREVTQDARPFGPYVNADHYAGLMEMLFPLVLCLFLFYKPGVTYGSFRERVLGIFDHKMTNAHILLGFSSVLIATSIFLTRSRGAITSLCISMIAMGAVLMVKDRTKTGLKLAALIFIIILFSVSWFGWTPVFEKFGKVKDDADMAAMRPVMWSDSMKIVRDFPITGTGFGSFVHIYPKYRSISAEGVLDHAHNDYLELFAEGGFIGVALFGWFLAEVFLKSFRAYIRRRELYTIYVFAGAAAGVLSILLHSFVDFNLHIGANGLYFFFLLGLAVSAANTRMREGLGDTSLGMRGRPYLKKLGAVSIVVLVSSVIFNAGALIGAIVFSPVKELSLRAQDVKEDLLRRKGLSHRASFFDPLEAGYYYAAADAKWRLSEKEEALADYRKALRLDPVNAGYMQITGLLMAQLGKNETAGLFLRAGLDFDVSSPLVYERYASWLFAVGKKGEGVETLKKAISLQPGKTREYVTLMVLYGLNDEQIRSALPERAEPHLLFAEYLSATGNETMAAEEYEDALDKIVKEKAPRPSFFYRIYHYYDKKGMPDDALMVMKRAIEILPDDAGIHLVAGTAYEKSGITYRAMEEYRKALVIDPGNTTARKKLDGPGQ